MLTVKFRGNVISGISNIELRGESLYLSGGATNFKFDDVKSVMARMKGRFNSVEATTVTMMKPIINTSHISCDNLVAILDGCDAEVVKNDNYKVKDVELDEEGVITLIDSSNTAEIMEVETDFDMYTENSVILPKCEVFIDGNVIDECVAKDIVCVMDYKQLCKRVDMRTTVENTRVKSRIAFVKREFVMNNTDFYVPFGCGFEHVTDKETGKMNLDGVLPFYATHSSAAADFRSSEDKVIPPVEVIDGKLVAKPTLVHTGIKAYMNNCDVLHLYNRSSNPKRGLVLANGVGVVDADYYNNESNDGDIMFAFFNFSGEPVEIKKGDVIGQGEFSVFRRPNDAVVNDVKRSGGFGSTSK